jgi:hypothetical protein
VTRIEERHARPWSKVARVETSVGVVWLKQVSPELAFEPGLTLELSRAQRRLAPNVLAADGLRLATAHAGKRLPLTSWWRTARRSSSTGRRRSSAIHSAALPARSGWSSALSE